MAVRIFTFFLIFLLYSTIANAQGDLLITPKRVVFEGNKQRETINLVNIGNDTARYSISFVQKYMTEDGNFVTVESSDSVGMSAEPFIRIFPRTVTLAPSEPQLVMLQYRRKADMPAGEYRSHLYIRAETNFHPLGLNNSKGDSTSVSVQLIPVFGISIPVIIRTGEVNVSSTLSNLKLETVQDTLQSLKVTINRTGNCSLYGDIVVEYFPVQGKSYEVGIVKGVGIYTEINKRNMVINLRNSARKVFTNGKLKVQYIGGDDKKRIVYAFAELEL